MFTGMALEPGCSHQRGLWSGDPVLTSLALCPLQVSLTVTEEEDVALCSHSASQKDTACKARLQGVRVSELTHALQPCLVSPGVYAFGFLFMLPQLFVNYKVRHSPS